MTMMSTTIADLAFPRQFFYFPMSENMEPNGGVPEAFPPENGINSNGKSVCHVNAVI